MIDLYIVIVVGCGVHQTKQFIYLMKFVWINFAELAYFAYIYLYVCTYTCNLIYLCVETYTYFQNAYNISTVCFVCTPASPFNLISLLRAIVIKSEHGRLCAFGGDQITHIKITKRKNESSPIIRKSHHSTQFVRDFNTPYFQHRDWSNANVEENVIPLDSIIKPDETKTPCEL